MGNQEKEDIHCHLPYVCAHVLLVCMPTDRPGLELYPLLSHTPGMVVLCCHSTACARAQKSEKEKGLALAVAKAWHPHLGKLAQRVPVVLLGSGNTLLVCRKDTAPGGGGRDSPSPSCWSEQGPSSWARWDVQLVEGGPQQSHRASVGRRAWPLVLLFIPLWISTHPQPAAGPQIPA